MAKRARESEKAERLLAGYTPLQLSAEEVGDSARRWRHTFARRVHDQIGEWTYRGFDWHAFSDGLVFALSYETARTEYRRRQRPQQFIVLIGPTMSAGFSCKAETLPWIERAYLDVYVVAANFGWTMVFTHEGDYLGPYFPQWQDSCRLS